MTFSVIIVFGINETVTPQEVIQKIKENVRCSRTQIRIPIPIPIGKLFKDQSDISGSKAFKQSQNLLPMVIGSVVVLPIAVLPKKMQ